MMQTQTDLELRYHGASIGDTDTAKPTTCGARHPIPRVSPWRACPHAGLLAVGLLAAGLLAGGCGEMAQLDVAAGTGPQPNLPQPAPTSIPTVNIAPAIGWPPGVRPVPAEGTQVQPFAAGLDHPRWLYLLPNGDVLAAETNAPPKPDDGRGIRGWLMGKVMQRAGAGTPSANRITLLRDTDGDGVADMRSVLLEGLNSPFGMALVGDQLFVATSDAVLRFPYRRGDTHITAPAVKVLDLPAGPINHHWTKNLLASADGRKLYVTIGSNSNVGERGMAAEAGRAAIWELDLAQGTHRIFASGLRNPNGMAWVPGTPSGTSGKDSKGSGASERAAADAGSAALWTVVNERDEIGSDLVPDYMTAVHDGAFYGWPFSYYGQHVDVRVQPPEPDCVARAISPDYALGPHTASLGLAAAAGNSLPERFAQGMFIGQHGSWNRRPHSGYKVIFVPFVAGRPQGPPLEVLGGFLSVDGNAYGRPVGVVLDRTGALLVADDVGNVIWRVSALR
jgi:glucose/arabinose dehydrogenase